MIGFGVFGLLVYYLSLYYRPLRLLDSMLANMASGMPEALFFFDANCHCIWANRPAIALTGIEEDNFEAASGRLREMFGTYDGQASVQCEVTAGDATKSYILEKHSVTDDRGRPVGAFLSVRDNTAEQETLQQAMHKATHDGLTGLYNRSGYDLLMASLDLSTTYLLLIDADAFKSINDTCGHDVGDRALRRIADAIRRHFRADDCVCRIGGDEFVVFMTHTPARQRQSIVARLRRINEELAAAGDGLPSLSVSAGIAHGGEAADKTELFEHADRALYETKRRGKGGWTFYGDGGAAASPDKEG